MTKFEARVKHLLEGAVQLKNSGGLPGLNANSGMTQSNAQSGVQSNVQNGQVEDEDIIEFTALLSGAATNADTPDIDTKISEFRKRRPDLFENLGNTFNKIYSNNGGL